MHTGVQQFISPPSKGLTKAVFHTDGNIQPWLDSLSISLECRIQGPTMASLETIQMQESEERNEEHREVDDAVERYNRAALAGNVDPDDTSLQVFILGEPTDANECNTLAAINTALVSSAINDPKRTIAAFLPAGSRQANDAVKSIDPQAPMAALRSLIQGFNVLTFDSMDDLAGHLGARALAS